MQISGLAAWMFGQPSTPRTTRCVLHNIANKRRLPVSPLSPAEEVAQRRHPIPVNLDTIYKQPFPGSPAPKGRFTSGQGKRKPKTRQSLLVLTS